MSTVPLIKNALLGSVFFLLLGGQRLLLATPPFSAQSSKIVDGQGRDLLLRGVNLSNAHKWPDPKTGGYFPHWLRAEVFADIKAMGFNSVRFLVSWEALEPQDGAYDRAYLEALLQHVRDAHRQGLWMVIDFHQDLYNRKYGGNGFPHWAVRDDALPFAHRPVWYLNYAEPALSRAFQSFYQNRDGIRSKFVQAMREVFLTLQGESNVIGYDILNEPWPGELTLDPARLRELDRAYLLPFYNEVAKNLWEVDQGRLLFFEPFAVRTNVLGTGGFPQGFVREDFRLPHIFVFAPHFYDPLITLTGTYHQNLERLEKILSAYQQEAARLGMPLWIGEWGVWPRQTEQGEVCCIENAEAFLQDTLALFSRQSISWAVWNYNLSAEPMDIRSHWREPFALHLNK